MISIDGATIISNNGQIIAAGSIINIQEASKMAPNSSCKIL